MISVMAAVAAFTHFQLSKVFANAAEDEPQTVSSAHFVTFYDEDSKLTVKTTAHTVREALERAKILINDADHVEPALDTEIDANNFYINIYRAYPVILIDGIAKTYAMTSSHDAKSIMVGAGITVYDGDEIELVPNTSFLESGIATTYRINRNGGQVVTIEEEIPYTEKKVKDYNIPVGTTDVRQLGEVGRVDKVYKVLSVDGVEISRILLNENVIKEPVERIVAVGASAIQRHPLTAVMGRNVYTVTKPDGTKIERQETFYDLPMRGVMGFCGGGTYHVREDGVKVDQDGYILVAADLNRYPRCSIVETSLGQGKVYDTGTFALSNPEQFDIATDWTNRNGI
ncbi:G5 domain-containing protein [Candidatus Saccharibacteria bacterium]|nr:G5 domain-containing protein [Candidatus Saccharibacteria bacterium]